MTLKDVLKMLNCNDFNELIPRIEGKSLYCIPNSSIRITICFMCEEETWENVSIYSPLLVPWYDCPVTAIDPENDRSICVWMKEEDYIINQSWGQYVNVED